VSKAALGWDMFRAPPQVVAYIFLWLHHQHQVHYAATAHTRRPPGSAAVGSPLLDQHWSTLTHLDVAVQVLVVPGAFCAVQHQVSWDALPTSSHQAMLCEVSHPPLHHLYPTLLSTAAAAAAAATAAVGAAGWLQLLCYLLCSSCWRLARGEGLPLPVGLPLLQHPALQGS
jgi:hypothetical protein